MRRRNENRHFSVIIRHFSGDQILAKYIPETVSNPSVLNFQAFCRAKLSPRLWEILALIHFPVDNKTHKRYKLYNYGLNCSHNIWHFLHRKRLGEHIK